jgi:hypothetical protein
MAFYFTQINFFFNSYFRTWVKMPGDSDHSIGLFQVHPIPGENIPSPIRQILNIFVGGSNH